MSLDTRICKVMLFSFVVGVLLIVRLFYLQVVDGSYLAARSISGRIQGVAVDSGRGSILDRNGVPLTNTSQRFSILIFPQQIEDRKESAAKLALLTGLSYDKILDDMTKFSHPYRLKSDIDLSMAQMLDDLKLPGVVISCEKIRYNYDNVAAHVTGYINMADNRGVTGIEEQYDDILAQAEPEYAAALVDARQNIIPGLGYKRLRLSNDSLKRNIVLTLDYNIQKVVESVMDKHIKKGAVVLMRPFTGEIVAMASRPNFNPSSLSDYLYLDTAPFLNRAVSAYQPGSVFKLVVAAAALENNVVKPNEEFYDPGYIDVNGLRFKGWDYERGGRGKITFVEAMAYSSNPVFIDIGLRLGAEKLVDYAVRLGFGEKTSLNFIGEAAGNLPEPQSMYPGDVANFAIGQGVLEATPLQIACLVATIVNDGIKVNPHLVSKITTDKGASTDLHEPSTKVRVLSKRTTDQLKNMMQEVTLSGTGKGAYIKGFGSAGKTGTAETGRQDPFGRGINHAWFVGYTPVDKPEYVAVIFVEDGMSGGEVAAPIFYEIMSKVLHDIR